MGNLCTRWLVGVGAEAPPAAWEKKPHDVMLMMAAHLGRSADPRPIQSINE